MRALPEPDQDILAEFVLEVVAERRLDRLLASDASLRLLERMAQAAIEEHRQGKTIDLNDVCC
jgi:hypothetical protein